MYLLLDNSGFVVARVSSTAAMARATQQLRDGDFSAEVAPREEIITEWMFTEILADIKTH